jgi:curved DNA-binding protein CbpA
VIADFYEVLGVGREASEDELRSAHRSLVLSLHPDTRSPSVDGGDADAALRLVNEAWSVLGDPTRRAAYDEALEERPVPVDGEGWPHVDAPRFPWWIVVLAILLVIFIFTAYAGAPAGAP